MSDPHATRPLGRSGLEVTQLGFGAAPLGGLFAHSSAEESLSAIQAASDEGIRYLDTAPLYGLGLSERRVGDAIREIGRDQFVLSTKVGRVLRKPAAGRSPTATQFEGALPFEVVFDYSFDGVMRSFEDSLQRLGTDRIDILLIHDINRKYHGDAVPERLAEVMNGGYRALERLRAERAVRAIGAGINDLAVLTALAEQGDFDCFMLPGRFTLLDQSAAETFLPFCERRGIAILAAAPFESGILATGPVSGARYNYAPAPPEILNRVARIEAICNAYGISLASAALNFALTHPSVTSVVTGMRSAQEVSRNCALMNAPIPQDLWSELRAEHLVRGC